MNLLRFIVKRKILVGLMVVLIFLLGSYALLKLDQELFPEVTMDGAYIEIYAGDTAAIEVERSITTPLEQQMEGIEGVEDINSTTNMGRSSFQLTFEQGEGDEVYKEVESIVNTMASDNNTIDEVEAGQYATTQGYEFYMDVSGGDTDDMSVFAEDVLEPRLESLPEVRDVSISGQAEKEVAIEFDREELTDRGLDINQVIGSIEGANNESTLGELSEDDGSPSLRWTTNLETVDDVKKIDIQTEDGFVQLDELATVSLQPLENSSFVWKNGSSDFMFVQVGRVSEATQIEMAEAVRAEVNEIRNEGLVDGFELNEMVAQADYVEESLDGVTTNILIGGILAIVILLLFLRNIRATFIIGLSIPTSILLTFASMWLFDYSFNILTLIGLGLGIGMMVDSSIVILESIYRKKEIGLANMDAVIEGTKEVATAVIASMLTTIVVFLPIGLLGGETGQFMIMLSVVVAITLISSVIVSFTLIPSLSENFLKLSQSKKTKKESRIIEKYSRIVAWTVRKKRHSLAVISIFVLMFVGSLFLVTKVPMTIMPDVFNRYSELMVDLDTGLTNDDRENIAQEMNETLSDIQDVESNYVIDMGGMFYTMINMTKEDEVTREQDEVNEEILKSLRELEDSQPIRSVESMMSAGAGGSPVQVNIKGENFEELQAISDDFTKELEGIEGIVGVASSNERTSIEQEIVLKEDEIEDAGLSESQIRQSIEQAFLERPLGEMTIEEEDVPLTVKWEEQERTGSETALLNLEVITAEGEEKLANFIELSEVETPNEITHSNGERFVSLTADIEGTDLGTVNREVQSVIDDYETKAGYSVSVAGDLEQQQELIQEMLLILGIAIFLVYLVMAVQFNHLAHPLIVMSVIPMTIVGVILGLFVTQRELSIMSGMGVIMLIGIVLNNAILYIDRTNQLRNQGFKIEDSLIEAGKNRIRPIFMTSLTTAAGMLPLALATGSSGNYQSPMATVIISGLLFATVITLLLIPAVYRLFSNARLRFWKSRRKRKKEDMIEETESAS
ncbi:multidrug transporter AcrB [Halobacillus andaensis]|uniref:Multidrug transporter AcrB n=1 Tax=Halobacillus andaensis TaxID=1176239 RepID=A0A917EW57_HALAA|nr:efflux RND transporter permease subunit [Halobacillus andaensis]MBP2006078.1 HAE1 family hydrophobic/amphiphilic exporter-1 [Halobacillus andaensis]GGF23784.1 multidrug transporter AcrB [Halobacillus andaensis]